MRRAAGIVRATVAALVLWAAIVVVGTRESWWRPLPAPRGDAAAFRGHRGDAEPKKASFIDKKLALSLLGAAICIV